MKKYLIILLSFLYSFIGNSQCNQYQVYESFGVASLPTQGGTWAQNSMFSSSNNPRTGVRSLTFNGTGDFIRTPLLNNVSSLSFWYRRSSKTDAWSCVIETSPDDTTWTSRGTITIITATYQQYTLNLSSLGLNNVYVRIRDTRPGTVSRERYLDDLSWISSNSNNNVTIPFPIIGNCNQSVGLITLTVFDQGGLNDSYNDNLNQIVTFTPTDNTKKLELNFTFFNLENLAGISFDTLIIYNGPSITSPLIGKYIGSTIPSSIISSATNGELTVRFISDASNITGTWGYQATIQMVTPLPVELIYFDGVGNTSFNKLIWSTASEHNSDYFQIERSIDGVEWKTIGTKTASGNSNTKIDYSFIDSFDDFVINYYRLVQVDYDGQYKIYGPISVDNTKSTKKVVGYINLFGQEVNSDTKGFIFEVYEDGTMKKIIR